MAAGGAETAAGGGGEFLEQGKDLGGAAGGFNWIWGIGLDGAEILSYERRHGCPSGGADLLTEGRAE